MQAILSNVLSSSSTRYMGKLQDPTRIRQKAIFRNIVKEQTYINPEPPIFEPMLLNLAKRLNGHIELPNTLQGQLVLRRFDCAGFAPTSGMNILGPRVYGNFYGCDFVFFS